MPAEPTPLRVEIASVSRLPGAADVVLAVATVTVVSLAPRGRLAVAGTETQHQQGRRSGRRQFVEER